MLLTSAEFEFLDGYTYEVFSPELTGPHVKAAMDRGIRQWDLTVLMSEHNEEASRARRSHLSTRHEPPIPCPWAGRDQVQERSLEIQAALTTDH